MKTRPEALGEIESQSFDVCVIGAGATGAGCALDAQLRGLRTVLLDGGDFSSASSSASTKLAHGGVRYLQQAVAEFDVKQLQVVRQALCERALMLDNAPHLAHACEFVVPCFSRFELLYYGFGLKLYDWFSGRASLGPSRVLSRQASAAAFPLLTQEHLAGSILYLDGQFDDARFGVTLVKSFANTGGVAANYLAVIGFERSSDGRLTAAIVRDAFTGRRIVVKARAFVNATGAFSDRLRSLAGSVAPPRLVPSKGVHILLPLDSNITRALLIPETEDGRVIFAIPWQGRLLVGTTDDEVPLDDDLVVTHQEADYLLRHLNRYLLRPYSVDDVVAGFAGLRPLVRNKNAKHTRDLVREHEVEVDESSGLVSILGGKWTTYRAMAQDTIDAVQKQLGAGERQCLSANFRLCGAQGYGRDQWKKLVDDFGVSEATARHLNQKFGSEAASVLALAQENPDLKVPIATGTDPILAEVVYSARYEMAVTIEDVLARRIGLQSFSWELAMQAAPAVAALLARELAWSDASTERALQEYVHEIGGLREHIAASKQDHSLERARRG